MSNPANVVIDGIIHSLQELGLIAACIAALIVLFVLVGEVVGNHLKNRSLEPRPGWDYIRPGEQDPDILTAWFTGCLNRPKTHALWCPDCSGDLSLDFRTPAPDYAVIEDNYAHDSDYTAECPYCGAGFVLTFLPGGVVTGRRDRLPRGFVTDVERVVKSMPTETAIDHLNKMGGPS